MEKLYNIYDNLSDVYSELENIMGSIYEDMQIDSRNEKSVSLLQGLGNVALKVLSLQKDLVEEYGDKDIQEALLSNIDLKEVTMTTGLFKDLSQINNSKTR